MANLAFHHLGLAVQQPQEALTFLSSLGYSHGDPVFDSLQNIHLIMGTHPSHPAIEIIFPASGSGPLDKIIRRRLSGIIYHVCYVTENLEQTLEQWTMAQLRVVCVSPPKPSVLFWGRKVSFYEVVGMGLIEILE